MVLGGASTQWICPCKEVRRRVSYGVVKRRMSDKYPKLSFSTLDGSMVPIKRDAAKPDRLNCNSLLYPLLVIISVHPGLNLINSENDLVMLENVNPAVILFHIKQRYHTNQV